MLDPFPGRRFAERAAWKAGWWAYRQGLSPRRFDYFDQGAADFPRSDYRPSWLYWSGRAARRPATSRPASRGCGSPPPTITTPTTAASRSSASRGERGGAVAPTLQRQAPAPVAIRRPSRIATLLSVGLNREAMGELQYAQRMWGDSPPLQATIALTHHRLGNLRAGINAMKRAYPQFLAAGGETLPTEILQVIFPLDYWPLLQKYAKATRPRSVRGRRAGRAGVDVRRRTSCRTPTPGA